jgi:hypothetical protein
MGLLHSPVEQTTPQARSGLVACVDARRLAELFTPSVQRLDRLGGFSAPRVRVQRQARNRFAAAQDSNGFTPFDLVQPLIEQLLGFVRVNVSHTEAIRFLRAHYPRSTAVSIDGDAEAMG